MQAAAYAVERELLAKGEITQQTPLGERFSRVAEVVRERYMPGRRSEPSRVASSRAAPARTNGHSYNDLSQEAKNACMRYAGELVGKGKTYATVKEWQNVYAELVHSRGGETGRH